jgi:uncharacterized protein YecT (DUF1311 family)
MRLLLIGSLFGVLLSAPLHAQQPDCLSAKDECLGLTDHNQTVQCLKKQNQALTHELKAANDDLLDKLKLAEQTLSKRYHGKLVRRYQSAEKAWEKYRLTQCDYERMHALGGIEEPIVDLQCKNELGRQRLVVLREQIKMWSY